MVRVLASGAVKARRLAALVFVLIALWPIAAGAQALPSLSAVRVRYNTLKNTTKPDGELKAQIDAIDRELAEAITRGQDGEARRLLAKGTTLLNGRPWTDEDEYRNSLVLRADHVFADTTAPFDVRLEQIYAPAIELPSTPTA